MYIDRLAALYETKKIPFVIHNGVFWRNYQGMVEPLGPVLQNYHIEKKEARKLQEKLGGWLIRWTEYNAPPLTASDNDWYAVLCFDALELENLPSKKRKKLKKAKENCTCQIVPTELIARQGYEIYRKAHIRYSNNKNNIVSETAFKEDILQEIPFQDIIQYCGVFVKGNLVGYSKVYLYDDAEAGCAVSKYDPDYLSYQISDAMVLYRQEEYLKSKKVKYISVGYKTLDHQTTVQDYYCRKFNFKKIKLPLHILYAQKINWAMPFVRMFPKIASNISPKILPLIKLDKLAT